MVIEYPAPDIRDRQFQLADGFLHLPGPGMVAHQLQRRFQTPARGYQPVHHEVAHALRDAVVILREAYSHRRRVARPSGRRTECRPRTRLVQFRYHPVEGHVRGRHHASLWHLWS